MSSEHAEGPVHDAVLQTGDSKVPVPCAHQAAEAPLSTDSVVQLADQCRAAFNHYEPIPGYKLRERIGSGGCGEVWKADAPGGLSKAVKIIFGQASGKYAERELKSLNRMKQVQHPFVLSLERIEVVDDHLIIVMELAHSSLQDRFNRCRSEGLPAIPREELLDYLRDAADALDYLYESHSLQHLDVKPENLLLLGKHIKVADFGLAKHIDDVQESMIGGLTPLYAPPEMFDGRPTRHSDQYSLAVVYQHMLTGEPPFGGRTTAQLAAQHLRSQPILSPLPESDRRAVTRALAKNPEKRFSCCRAFVDRLLNHRPSAGSTCRRRARPASDGPQADPGNSSTQTLSTVPCTSQGTRTSTVRVSPGASLHERPVHETKSTAAQAGSKISLNGDAGYRPTLVVGLGGTAAHVLRKLRARLTDRFGKLEAVPAFQLLQLDTDTDELDSKRVAGEHDALSLRETMLLPLSEPKDYRAKSQSLLEWMSRRWLYNIPRSLKTEGIRPLGRLALIDHFDAVLDRLRLALGEAISPEALQSTGNTAGLRFDAGPPRIFVIASISGGTGSGAVLDLAYTLRMVAAEFDQSDQDFTGILLHSTSPRAAARDLAISNTIACLSELDYYAGPEGFYPGEPACGIQAFRQDSAPFRHTYLVHLGDQLTRERHQEKAESVAEYVYQSSATPAAEFFDRCRKRSQERSDSPAVKLRSFGLTRLRSSRGAACGPTAETLCRALVRKWIEGSAARGNEQRLGHSDSRYPRAGRDAGPGDSTCEVSQTARECAEFLQLDLARLLARAEEVIRRELGGEPERELKRAVREIRERLGFSGLSSRNGGNAQAMLDAIDATLFERARRPDEPGGAELQSVVEAALEQSLEEKVLILRKWLLDIVDVPNARLHKALQTDSWFRHHLESLAREVHDTRQGLEQEIRRVEKSVTSAAHPEASASSHREQANDERHDDCPLLRLAQLQLEQIKHRAVATALRWIGTRLKEGSERLEAIRTGLMELEKNFQAPGASLSRRLAAGEDSGSFCEFKRGISNPERLIAALDQQLDENFFRLKFPLSKFPDASVAQKNALTGSMREAATNCLEEAFHQLRLDENRSDNLTSAAALREGLQQAAPHGLDQWGGRKRLLLSPPQKFNPQLEVVRKWAEQTEGQAPVVVPHSETDTVICYEVEQIPLPHVLSTLIGSRRDYLDIAARLHTRVDIDWPS